MATLEALFANLNKAARALDKAAAQIRDVPLEPTRENIRRIANILIEIFELQQQIYPLRPELIPEHLWDIRKGRPTRELIIEGAFRRARVAVRAGDTSKAIDVLGFLMRCQPSGPHVKRARAQITKLRKT
jgi:hypothetical protein